MGWCELDATGRVISCGHGEGPARQGVRPLSEHRVTALLEGQLPLHMALSPDAVLAGMQHRAWPQHAPDHHAWPADRVTLMGAKASWTVWNKILEAVSLDLLGDRHLVVWDWRYNDNKPIHTMWPEQLWQIVTADHDPRSIILIIDSHWEAPDPTRHFGPIAQRLARDGMRPQQIVNWSNISKPWSGGVSINVDFVLSAGGHGPVPVPDQPQALHHFIMLARQPRALRAMVASEILLRGLDDRGHISCGANADGDHRHWMDRWVPAELHHRFPMLLDGHIPQGDTMQYRLVDPRITGAAINVIAETSQDPQLSWAQENDWFDPFITEKTIKAFRLLQLPIWAAVPGQVQITRDLGFDVYDDIIDHGYDHETDPSSRVQLVVDQLQRFCDMPLQQVDQLRASIWPRICANRDLAQQLITSSYVRMSGLLSAYLQGLDSG